MRIGTAEAAKDQQQSHRAGRLKLRRLLQGDPRSPNNFEWSLVTMGEDYSTPRHRHNFSQIIHVLEGTLELAPRLEAAAGTVVYTAEGTSYGPQSGRGSLQLTLQFGDASGNGFLSYDGVAEGGRRLAERGTFENGAYRYHDDQGRRHNQDAYEAIWEEMNGRALEYPSPRYAGPVVMNPAAFEWLSAEGEPGLRRKRLGAFNERQTTIDFLAYAPGAVHRVAGLAAPELHFVLDGALHCGERRLERWAALMIEPGDDLSLRASEAAEAFVIGLPRLEREGAAPHGAGTGRRAGP